jgi:hypothetical protein
VEAQRCSPWPLGYTSQSDVVAEALQGLNGAFLLAFLLSVLQAIVPRLLIARPLAEEVVDHHQNFLRDGHRRFLAPEAPFKTPKRVSEEGWGFAGGSCLTMTGQITCDKKRSVSLANDTIKVCDR